MDFTFRPLQKEDALAVLNWRYPSPYERYTFKANSQPEDLRYLIDPQNAFFAILNQHKELEGYCSFGPDGQVPGGNYRGDALDLGLGLRPDLTGQGNGKHYAQAVIQYGIDHCRPQQLRVTIAVFNQRAQRLWQTLGFETVDAFVKTGSSDKFVMMTRSLAP
jgi:ribosomal-protein-alanine N-acetyltransferase